jgi:hypothetical protein
MYNLNDFVICSTFGGRIIMKVNSNNKFEYTIELPCGIITRVEESSIIKRK